MADRILELLSGLGLPGLFAGVFIEAVGLPFPGSVLVALAGFLAYQGTFPIISAWLVSLLGYLSGSLAAFMLGRRFGETFIKNKMKYIGLTPQRVNKAQRLLQKSAPLYIIGGRFLPTIGNITPYIAGISGISIAKFLACDMVHAVLWLTAFLGVGATLGNNWQTIVGNPYFKWGTVISGLLILLYVFKKLMPVHGKSGV